MTTGTGITYLRSWYICFRLCRHLVRFSLFSFGSKSCASSSQSRSAQKMWKRAHFSTRDTETLSVRFSCVMSLRTARVVLQMNSNQSPTVSPDLCATYSMDKTGSGALCFNSLTNNTIYQCCGSKYIKFGSGSGIFAQFGSGSGSRVIQSIMKEKIQNNFLLNKYQYQYIFFKL